MDDGCEKSKEIITLINYQLIRQAIIPSGIVNNYNSYCTVGPYNLFCSSLESAFK